MKFVVIEFTCPMIYLREESMRNMPPIGSVLYEMYEEHVLSSEQSVEVVIGNMGGGSKSIRSSNNILDKLFYSKKYNGKHDFTSYVSAKKKV